jgi:hypothetical protein
MRPYLLISISLATVGLAVAGQPAGLAARLDAALAWCVEDAAAARAAGQAEVATAAESDAVTLRALADAGNPVASSAPTAAVSPPADLLPPIPGELLANPIARDFIKRVETLVRENKTFAKGPDGGAARDATGWAFPTRADQLLNLTQALCHPQSPLAGDARLVAPILRRVSSISEYLVPGAKILGDFGFADTVAEAWLILRTVHPEILPAGLAARMEAGLKTNAAFIVEKWGATFSDPTVHYGVVNMDVRRILALALTDRLFPNPAYRERVKSGVRFIGHSVLADGATHYAERQNECFSYHMAAVRSLLRISQLADLPEARELVKAMRWYYPLSVEPGGVAEWATASSWHHYWNTASGSDGALIMAAVTNCPHNQRIAQSSPPKGDLWLASFLRPDLQPAPTPDRYFLYDRNVEGPRGRFGNWSMVGTGRNFGYTAMDKARGKSSYVGAVLTTGPTGNWPLDAALQDVGTAVKLSPQPLPAGEIPWLHALACLTSVETTTSAVGERCAALGANALLSAYGKKPTPWRQRQAWVFTPERLIGLVEITAETDTTANGVLGTVMLVSGRLSWGKRKELESVGPGQYTYGGLAVTFHAHDFAEIASQYTDVMSGSVIHGTDTPNKSVRLLLKDAGAVRDAATSYAKGARQFYVLEIRPKTSAPALRVERRSAGNLLSFLVQDATGTYELAYNPEATPAAWSPSVGEAVKVGAQAKAGTGESWVHRSGETYRPSWVGPEGKPEVTRPAMRWTGGSFTVPAGEVVLVEEPAKP